LAATLEQAVEPAEEAWRRAERPGRFLTVSPRLRHVRAESVALIPSCVECNALWLPADEKRCPLRAEREFKQA
jgi:hypothetical protein